LAAPASLTQIKARPAAGVQHAAMVAFTLPHKLALLTAIKLVAFALIYALVFAPVSHAPIDAVARIAGPAAHP
jgi:hypothetical protein